MSANAVTNGEIEAAREMDLLTYLQRAAPGDLVRKSANEYRTKQHSSLVISNGLWHWVNGGVGGRSALDYLVKAEGMAFTDAVRHLLSISPAPVPGYAQPQQQRKPQPGKGPRAEGRPTFKPPEKSAKNDYAYAYLVSRGIDRDIANHCLESGIVYESKRYHNCVFVGHDAEHVPRCAAIRGTMGSSYRADAPGSDKRYSFTLPAGQDGSNEAAVFESAIDALSHATLTKMQGGDWQGIHRLSLAGTSMKPLETFLAAHPEINTITVCTDNDEAGRKASQKIRGAYESKGYAVKEALPEGGKAKDYNDFLKLYLKEPKKHMPCAENNREAI